MRFVALYLAGRFWQAMAVRHSRRAARAYERWQAAVAHDVPRAGRLRTFQRFVSESARAGVARRRSEVFFARLGGGAT